MPVSTTRDTILDSALDLVENEGGGAVTLERVATAAGLSKGGLLYHFASKEDLLAGLVQRAVQSLAVRDVFAAVLAAYTINPASLGPLRERYRAMWPDASSDRIAWLAAECLALFEHIGFVQLGDHEKQTLVRKISSLSKEQIMPEQIALIQPAIPAAAPVIAAALSAEFDALKQRALASGRRAAESLHARQNAAGYWRGDLTADTTLESDYVLLNLWLHPAELSGWNPPSKTRLDKAMVTILKRQLPDGGWSIYPDGPSELNATARAYTALKLCGFSTDDPRLQRARERVLALGGLQAANSYTKINLSFFGLFPKEFAPSVPPELLLVPGNFIYEMSSWTRAIIVPLSILQASGVRRATPKGLTIDELFLPGKKLVLPKKDRISAIFNQADRAIKLWDRRGMKDIRAKAVREAEKWMLERMRGAEGLGAIYPSMMYSIMAMDVLGYERDHPDFVGELKHFEDLILEGSDELEFQPAVSPLWDTAIATFALGEAGLLSAEAGRKAADWILDREVRRKGDWCVKRPNIQPGGWAFEFANDSYPDIDDTAMVLLALEHAKATDEDRQSRAERRAINWLIGMQSTDGGWAAFDADNNWQVLNKVPFADHNAMLDPTCPDITGRVMDALCRRGLDSTHPSIAKAATYLKGTQRPDGSWYGRWGVNYIYGTFLAMQGLRAAAEARGNIERGAAFLRAVQNADGGWGESCVSYETHRFEAAPSTPSQTAWALLGLHAAGDTASTAVTRGLEWLTERQNAQGSWDEKLATGTGFPNVFYLNYNLYPHYFPLLALALCVKG